MRSNRFIYACAVRYVGGFGWLTLAFWSASEVGAPAVTVQFPAFISVYNVVDGLYGYGNTFFSQHATDLFGRPLMVNNHLFYTPHHHAVELLAGCGTLSALKGFCMSLFPQIVAFGCGIAF